MVKISAASLSLFAGLFLCANAMAAPEVDRNIYYSVGTTGTALYSGNASAAEKGQIVLASPASPQIGVGDEIRVGTNRYYIRGRESATAFRFQSSAVNGGSPGDTNITFASQNISIHRAFNHLKFALDVSLATPAKASDANHLNTANLTATPGYVLHVACYADGPELAIQTVRGWTTGPNNYIRIFTPHLPAEVGVTQRHSGKWDNSKFHISAAKSGEDAILMLFPNFIRVEGLQVEVTGAGNVNAINSFTSGSSGAGDARISNCILKNSNANNVWCGISINANNLNMVGKAWNNIIYGFGNGSGLYADVGTVYAYNNTIVGCRQGFYKSSIQLACKNNIVQGAGTAFYGVGFTGDYNVSNTSDAPGTHSRKNTAVAFVDAAGGDFHLAQDDAGAKDFGADLSNDPNLAFSTDIDGLLRGALWDAGADEAATAGLWEVSGKDIYNLNSGNVGIGKLPSANYMLDVRGPILTDSYMDIVSGVDGLRLMGADPSTAQSKIYNKRSGAGFTLGLGITANTDFTVSSDLRVIKNVGLGTNPVDGLRLNVAGKIKATEIEAGTLTGLSSLSLTGKITAGQIEAGIITGITSLEVSGDLNVPGKLSAGSGLFLTAGNDENFITYPCHNLTLRNEGFCHEVIKIQPTGDIQDRNYVDPATGTKPYDTDLFSYLELYDATNPASGHEADIEHPKKVQIASTGVSYFNGGGVGIGTDSPGNYKLAVEGTIGCRELVVTVDEWADYVFNRNYKLKPLTELEKEIKSQNHLPGMPSEQEVMKGGIGVGEMQKRLLEKIEELTLYVIEESKKTEKVSRENTELRAYLERYLTE